MSPEVYWKMECEIAREERDAARAEVEELRETLQMTRRDRDAAAGELLLEREDLRRRLSEAELMAGTRGRVAKENAEIATRQTDRAQKAEARETRLRDAMRKMATDYLHHDPFNKDNLHACGCPLCAVAREFLALATEPESRSLTPEEGDAYLDALDRVCEPLAAKPDDYEKPVHKELPGVRAAKSVRAKPDAEETWGPPPLPRDPEDGEGV